jgi:hypothetical protein
MNMTIPILLIGLAVYALGAGITAVIFRWCNGEDIGDVVVLAALLWPLAIIATPAFVVLIPVGVAIILGAWCGDWLRKRREP